jgi:hypothetical protein
METKAYRFVAFKVSVLWYMDMPNVGILFLEGEPGVSFNVGIV